jgi:hypothetical protein
MNGNTNTNTNNNNENENENENLNKNLNKNSQEQKNKMNLLNNELVALSSNDELSLNQSFNLYEKCEIKEPITLILTTKSESNQSLKAKLDLTVDIVPHVSILIHGGDEYDFINALAEMIDNSIQNTIFNNKLKKYFCQ